MSRNARLSERPGSPGKLFVGWYVYGAGDGQIFSPPPAFGFCCCQPRAKEATAAVTR